MSATRFRASPVDYFSFGDGAAIAARTDSCDPIVLHPKDAALLASCASWKSLEHHATDYLTLTIKHGLQQVPLLGFAHGLISRVLEAATRNVPMASYARLPTWVSVRERLDDLVRKDLLVPEPVRTGSAVEQNHAVPSEDGVRSLLLSIPSNGAVPLLRRCLESYCNAAHSYAHRFEEIAVASRSPTAESLLQEISAKYDLATTLLDQQWRCGLAKRLSDITDIPYEVAAFTLLGCEGIQCTTGANRNALLLNAIGRCSLTVDDDTLATAIPSPAQGTDDATITTISEIDPSEFWFFPDTIARTRSQRELRVDVMGSHHQFLGRRPGDILSDQKANTSDMCPHLLRDLIAGTGRVVLTHAGLAGDCGMSCASGLHFLAGPSRERLVASEAGYRTALTSREVIRLVPKPSVGHGVLCMSAAVAMDSRQMLPPFLPVFRNSDGLFGYLLRLFFDDYYIAYLPFAMEHDPSGVRMYASGQEDDFINVFDAAVVWECIREIAGSVRNTPTPSTRMRIAGEHLIDIGSLSPRAFNAYLMRLQMRAASERIASCDREISKYRGKPQYWADGLKSLKQQIKSTMPSDSSGAGGLSRRPGSAGASDAMQMIIALYGRLLYHWPALWQATHSLRSGPASHARQKVRTVVCV